ncbi:hypothetical protein B0T25DRAFT_608903 [Lasiosphaeria hispida]|uniref:Uncharacterized protein n=1 Tax=Lasiosphaeria hispida TaxID=260671 RepID=A0AAJ0HD79_9PEZI|nr:hypothetical protein B0T25DRAFT_608903 [Lasiosphaeria hispida]
MNAVGTPSNAPHTPPKKAKIGRAASILTATRSPHALITPPNNLRTTDAISPTEGPLHSEKRLTVTQSPTTPHPSPSLKTPPTPIIRSPDNLAYARWRAERTWTALANSLLPSESSPKPQPTTSPSPRPSPKMTPTTTPSLWTSPPKPPPARPWPPYTGSILCEPCFHADAARWLRTRRTVTAILRLLGGGGALEGMREAVGFAEQAELSWEGIEEAKRRAREKERLAVGTAAVRWWVPGSGMVVKKGVVVEEREVRVVSKLEKDVRGLLLLRREVARRVAEGGQKAPGVDKMLDSLRVEAGLERRELKDLEKRFADMLEQWEDIAVRGRSAREVLRTALSGEAPKKWQGYQQQWWAFDEALQDAHRKLASTKTESDIAGQSEFDATIAAKAREAFVAAAETKGQRISAGNTDETGKQGNPASEQENSSFQRFNLLVKTLGLNTQVQENLNKIGAEIAQVRLALEKQGKFAKAALLTEPPDMSSGESQASEDDSMLMLDSLPQELEHPTLPCLYCSESEAANRRYAYMQAQDMYRRKPWIKPLMWVYKNEELENAMATAKDFFGLMNKRGAFALHSIPGLSFQVDGSGGDSEIRIVLMEMKSIYDEISVSSTGWEWVGEALGVVDEYSKGEYMGSKAF